MSFAMAHNLGLGFLPDVNADGDVFENRLTHLLPTPTSSQLPLVHFETGSVLDVSVAGSNPEHLAYEGTVNDYAYRDDYRYGRDLSASRHAYDARGPGCPISLSLSPSQIPDCQGGMLDEPLPMFSAYGTIYTDDVRMKLGDGIRRQCSNCRTAVTKTWRRSKLNHGKLVCNKCGLFERAHLVPRPKTFPSRRRSRLASVQQSWEPPPDVEGRSHYNGHLPVMPFTGLPPYALNPEEGSAASMAPSTQAPQIPLGAPLFQPRDSTVPQDMAWMTHNTPVPDVSSGPSPIGPRLTGIPVPTLLRADLHLPTSYPTQHQVSTLHSGHGYHPM